MVSERLLPLRDLLPDERTAPGPIPDNLLALLERWDDWVHSVEAALDVSRPDGDDRRWRPAHATGFHAPTTHHPTMYCAGANFRDHVVEMGATPPDPAKEHPFHFLMPSASLTGHQTYVARPKGMHRLDWEAELAVVIGSRADRVPVEQALDHVAGYTVANDLSCRDDVAMKTPLFGINWLLQKGWRGLKPLGPAVVPARFVPAPDNLDIRLSVNGQVRQDSNTSQMIFSVAEQIAALSQLAPLHPGDVLMTGTPAGTAAAHQGRYLQPGDRVVAEITGVGRLLSTISGT
ncbi:fumarylacetoacetate hydrolase family protein [Streptomyces sp. NBC_00063]